MILAAALTASLAGKAASNQPVAPPDQKLFAERLESTFRLAGLQPSDRSLFSTGITVLASSEQCVLWATEYTPYGTMADVIAQRARSVGELRYVYKGRVYKHPPAIMPLLAFYWWRELKRIGIDAPRYPIVAIAASRECDLTLLPWINLAALPR